MKNIKKIISSDLCMSCGLCFDSYKETSLRKGVTVPKVKPGEDKFDFSLCPGKGYDIVAMGKSLFDDAPSSRFELGRWRNIYSARTFDEGILKEASSGGVMSGIALFLLEKKIVDGVIVTKLVCENDGFKSKTFIAYDKADLISAQGSKYMPVPALEVLPQLCNDNKSYAFIGTPCQIAAIRLMQQSDDVYKKLIPITIGNFCGGFRDLRETYTILKHIGFDPCNLTSLAYRGGGQPGFMRVSDRDGRVARLNYPDYARMTGYPVIRRCRLCVDATAELADFACGDAWLDKYLNTGQAWSLIITRSRKADEIFEQMRAEKRLKVDDVDASDVIKAQRTNINSKKYRQSARRLLYKLLLQKLPTFDGGYDTENLNILMEFKVVLSHTGFFMLEKMGLYSLVARLLKRNKCKVEISNNEK